MLESFSYTGGRKQEKETGEGNRGRKQEKETGAFRQWFVTTPWNLHDSLVLVLSWLGSGSVGITGDIKST